MSILTSVAAALGVSGSAAVGMVAVAWRERKFIRWSINVPEFAATMTLQVVYRAKQTELTTGERAHALADTMVAILRGSPRVKAVEIRCDSVGNIEPLDDNEGLTQVRVKP